MAKDDDSIAIQVDDLDSVAVEIDPKIAALAEEDSIKPAKEKKTTKRVSPEPDPVVQVATGPTEEQIAAIEEAKALAARSEEARKAAEATAAAERERAERAERDRLQARREAEQFAQRAANSETALIDHSISAAQAELDAQKENYQRAAEAGEFAKMADIQIKIAKAAAALDRLESEKTSVESSGGRATEGTVSAPDPVVSSKTEQFLTQFSPVAQTWLRQHMDCLPPEFGGDAVKNSKMMEGHYKAVGRAINQGTPEYFQVIEETLGLRQPPTASVVPDPTLTSKAADVVPAATTRKEAVPAAPVSRDAPGASGTPQRSVREVRLTKEQQEMAKISYPHLTDQQAFGMYARSLLELEAEGKLGRTTH